MRAEHPDAPTVTADASADPGGSDAAAAAAADAAADDIDLLGGGTAVERLSGQTILGFAAPLPRIPTPPPLRAVDDPSAGQPASTWQRPLGETQPEDAQEPPDGTSERPPHPAAPADLPSRPPGWMRTPSVPGPPAGPGPSPITPLGSPRGRTGGVLLGLIGAAVVGVGAWQIYTRTRTPDRPAKVAAAPGDAGASAAREPDAALPLAAVAIDAAPPDAGKLAAALDAAAPLDAAKLAALDAGTPLDATKLAALDAGTPLDATKLAAALDAGAPPDAARAAAAPPIAAGDTLAIASSPPGARVFLDGADTGATPVKLPGTPDRHTIALLLAGHELYVAQVDGHGSFQIPLKEVTPNNGPAGIKVLRCKPDRYYVYVDGKPTGQTCPTERIGCEVGQHTVEVYDVVSETRRKWDIVVKDTRLSFRVRVE